MNTSTSSLFASLNGFLFGLAIVFGMAYLLLKAHKDNDWQKIDIIGGVKIISAILGLFSGSKLAIGMIVGDITEYGQLANYQIVIYFGVFAVIAQCTFTLIQSWIGLYRKKVG